MGFKFHNGVPLFRNGNPSLCCCGDVCNYTITARFRGGTLYGQLDSQAVVSTFNPNAPAPNDEIGFGVSGPINVIQGTFTVSHTLRLWAGVLATDTPDLNEIRIEVNVGPICINGVQYETGDDVFLNDLIETIVDPGDGGGAATDQSSDTAGYVLTMACGAC